MKKLPLAKLLATAAVFGCLAAGNAHAVIMGEMWDVPDAIAATTLAIPGVPAPIMFTVNSQTLNFNTTNTSRSTWLDGPGPPTNVVGITGPAALLAAPMSNGNGVTGTGTLVRFTGTTGTVANEVFSVLHDDGIILTVDGQTVINAPGATSPTTSTGVYTGPIGNQPFTLIYGECCSGPAVLNAVFPPTTGVPEPASLALLGSALIGFGVWRRRRRPS